MITIMTKHDDNSTLDFLATECEYEVTILAATEAMGGVSALCEGANAGEKCRNLIDDQKLLRDSGIPFPSTVMAVSTYLTPFINSIGL